MNKTDKILNKISQQTVERYSGRYRKLGYDVKTLGWGTVEQQIYRFEQTLEIPVDLSDKTVLDIGCGFGDYYAFLKMKNINPGRYIGWDINPHLIEKSKDIHSSAKNVSFQEQNILDMTESDVAVADIGIMLGLLNFNLQSHFSNYEYSKIAVKRAFGLVRNVLIVDFLSSYRTESYPKEDFVFYHNPETMLSFALTLSDNVTLKHDYLPIPQKEFMLFIFKDNQSNDK